MIFREPFRMNRSIQIPSWDPLEESMTGVSSPVFIGSQSHGVDSFIDSFAAIHRYLPSNDFSAANSDMGCDGFSCDHFRMFEFKVRRCARGRSHDWTECPFAHPGEKARRRDPRKVLYSGTACPEFRKGNCKRGESCEFAHGIFECWLHPSRYRTQPCKDGISCRRRVCFFAHSPEELRVLPHPGSVDSIDSYLASGSFVTSPTSVLPSPPLSPPSINGLVASMHNLSIERNMKMGSQWVAPMQQNLLSPVTGKFDMLKEKYEEEPVMERVESGRDLRNKMYAKLRKDNSVNQNDSTVWNPDIDWVSELLE